jgi:hypothetical protein
MTRVPALTARVCPDPAINHVLYVPRLDGRRSMAHVDAAVSLLSRVCMSDRPWKECSLNMDVRNVMMTTGIQCPFSEQESRPIKANRD